MTRTPRRRGYTLVELIVVISIAVVLMTLLLAFGPSLAASNRISRSADQLQSWLLVAKTKAYRDRVPHGIRLIPDPANNNWCRELQFIERPEDITGLCAVSGNNVTNVRDKAGNAIPDLASAVQNGDFISFGTEANAPPCGHPIAGAAGNAVTLSDGGVTSLPSTSFRIYRQWRPTVGESSLLLPNDTVVEISSSLIPPANSLGSRDVVFDRSGQVIGMSGGKVCLWVRGVRPSGTPAATDFQNAGEQFLVTINARSGSIAVHPVAQSADPYAFTRDGRSSGL
jgi:prepilin-type N-terminal cleavage/methylation domain-containing protein